MVAKSDTTAWFIVGRVLSAYWGVLASGLPPCFYPYCSALWLLVMYPVAWLLLSDLSRFLQFLSQYRYLFFFTQCSRLSISAWVGSWGRNGTLKVISFGCSVPTLYFSGMLRKGCVLSDTFPWTGYVFKKLLVPLLLYFKLVDKLCWHFAWSREGFKNVPLPCYQFSNNGILGM